MLFKHNNDKGESEKKNLLTKNFDIPERKVNDPYSILIVDSDKRHLQLLSSQLLEAGFIIHTSDTAQCALEKISNTKFHFCILEIELSDMDGISLAQTLVKKDFDINLIFLTTRGMKCDIQRGYAIGCIEYMTKPYDIDILVLKIKAISEKRESWDNPNYQIKEFGNATIDTIYRRLYYNESQYVLLSRKESQILSYLFENANQPVSRKTLMKNTWGSSDYFINKSLDVHLVSIRKSLKKHTNLLIETIHSFGFVLTIDSNGN